MFLLNLLFFVWSVCYARVSSQDWSGEGYLLRPLRCLVGFFEVELMLDSIEMVSPMKSMMEVICFSELYSSLMPLSLFIFSK